MKNQKLYTEVITGIINGELDDAFQSIEAAIRNRRVLLNAEKHESLAVGDKVRFNHTVRPKYLVGVPATICKVRRKKVEVKLEVPVGRFRGAIVCTVGLLDKVN